ncbi:uncharacterized protein LOC126992984 isoform X6 [Eriocheir sinensis]|uniref:uncharacterized protein LOC126992984 isoform X6 n=1 Tax=Eriocheir sinensis TaxID=95602 RepID=UPI0021C780DF|nr:uncharacterized protein LOC126992984 isoform X6 [Eriocheir sinensis]
MPRLGFLSIFGGRTMGEGDSSGDGNGVCGGQQSEESPLSQGSSCKTPAKWRYSGHWSPPQPRPLTPRERTNSEELPRSMVNSCSWDESEPPSPAATLPPIPPLTLQASPCLGSRPVTDGELESSAVPLGERRRRRGVLKEAVTKILEDKKANRQARRRGCGQSGGGLPPPHPRRASRTATPESDDDSADFAAYLLQRRSWRGRRHRSTSSDAESESITTSQGDDNSPRASPSPRPGLARRASNFLLKSFRAVSMTMRLNKKFVPTYYLSGDHELPEPEQLLDKFGHSLDSRLEEKRSSHHEQRSLCVVWDLIPEDGSTPATARHHCPVDPASLDSSRESSRNASSTDLSHDESRACDTPTGSSPAWCCESSADEHIYEEPQPNGAAPTDDPTSDGSEALEPKNLLTWPRLREGRGSFPASTLLTLPEDMSAGGIKGSLGQGRQDSPYPRRCRGFRSLPCSPLVPATLPRPPRQQVPTLHLTPNTPMSPLAAQPPQTLPPRPVLSQRPPLPPLPPRGHPPHSVRGRLAQRESAPPYAQPQHGRSSNAQYSEYETENVRNIAFRRNGPQHSPLFISVPRNSSKVQFEMEEGGSHGSGRESPIYAQPYASSPGPCHTPSYTTPFKNVYSFTPTFQSPAEAIALPSPARDSNTPTQQNVFFGQDFEVEQHLGGRSPSLATQGRDCHRDSAYFSTDESTELGGGQEDAPRGPSPPFSSALLRQAIEHSLADSLHRLPEMVASEVTRQVRECLRSSTSEVAAELHKLSCSNNGSQQLAPKRPSTLDLLGSPRRRHMFSFSCEDLLGDDPFPEGLSLSRRSSRVGGTMSVADLDMCGDNQLCSMGVAGHWDHTTSVPTHLHHLHLEQGVAQVEVEGDVVELPYKHHQPLKEALTPLCRELSQSLLLEREGEGGVTGKSVVLRLKVNVDQLDGDDYSDTSMEWDYFDQRDGGGGDGRDNSGGSGGSAPSAANGHASNQMGQQQQQQQQQPQKDRQPNPTTTKKSPAQKGQVSFALLTTEITRDEGPTGASQALGPPPPPPAPPQPGMEESSGVGPVLSSPTLPPHPSAGPCGANTDAYWLTQGDNLQPSKQQRASMAGPNDLFFGEGDDKSSGLSHKDREERLRQLRDRQQMEKQQKLEELKEHAAAAQRFREQQENERRRRLEEMRMRDADRRSQVEERKKIIQQAEQDRREAVIRKTAEREQRMETKRRNERSNIVFAFGSSTPRMLDPKDNSSSSYWTARRATSTTNVHMVDGALARRASECGDMDLSRKRATSAHGLDRKPEDLRMSSSMYEVFHWDKSSSSHPHHPPTTQGTRLTKSRDSSLERKTPPSALSWVRSHTPQPPQSSTPISSDPHPPSSTSSSSSDKTPTNTSQSRFCVWEFGDNFTALGPANQSSGDNGQPASSSPASTPTSSTRYSRRTASVFTGAGCTVGGEDLMTRSMTAAIPATAARRRTDLMPAMPSLRDTGIRSSPRHRSPGRALSLGRLDELARPRHRNPPLAPLHESSSPQDRMTPPTRTMSKSMSHLAPRPPRPPGPEVAAGVLDRGVSRSSVTLAQPRLTRAEMLRQKKLRGTTEDNNTLAIKSSQRAQVSVGSASSVTKPTRAKSAGSDRSTPSTPARTPVKPATPKKTPAQVKAESAAKKAIEKSKSTPKAKVTPKTTPLQSPSVESKPVVAAKSKKSTSRESSTVENKSETPQVVTEAATVEEKPSTEGEQKAEEKSEPKTEAEITPASDSSTPAETQKPEEATVPTTEPTLAPSQEASEKMEVVNEIVADKDDPTPQVANVEEKSSNDAPESKVDEGEKQDEAEKNLAQKAADKPVTGYATEEEYKAALAEKRRLAREAKEREQELERQRQLEEEEKERKEEEEYLRLMEEQRKAEEDRLRKAIEEADRQREEEAKRKEEEEKQREENERIEQQKRVEAEVRLKKEEEERQARKSRVAAIMARTRGKGGSNTPTKNEAKTPSEEGKNFGDGLMSTSMTDSMIGSIIAAAESQSESAAPSNDQQQEASVCSPEVKAPESSQPQPPATSQTVTAIDSTVEMTQSSVVENIVSGVSSVKLEEAHVNGDSPVPMETTPTHTVDLLGTLSDVNSVNLNGVDNSTPPQTSQGRTDNLLDSLDPLSSPLSTSTTTTSTTSTTTTNITPAASNFEQIIDLGQTKLSNEDAVNSNPPSPFIAFEQNLNKKPNQENTSTVPDLLL